jgi:hypothetical protein
VAQEGEGPDYVEAVTETLNYLATLCPDGKAFVQLVYEVASLSSLLALLGSINSVLGTLSGASPVKCDFEEELNKVKLLISSGASDISLNKLRTATGKPPDIDKLNAKAVELANELGNLQSLVAYKIANCVSTVVSMAQAVQKATAQLQAQLQQALAKAQAPSQPTQEAPTAKAQATGWRAGTGQYPILGDQS